MKQPAISSDNEKSRFDSRRHNPISRSTL